MPSRRLTRLTLLAIVTASVAVGITRGASPAGAAAAPPTRIATASGNAEIPAGAWDAAISGDGRSLVFVSDEESLPGGDGFSSQVYVKNLSTGSVALVSRTTAGEVGDDSSFMPSISRTGRFVAFYSDSDVLDPRDANFSTDAYLHDRDADGDGVFDEAGAATRIEIASFHNGIGADFGVATDNPPSVSDDGAYVAFTTDHPFVVNDLNDSDDVYVKRMSGGMRWITRSGQGDNEGGGGSNGHLSADGRFVVFQSASIDILATNDFDFLSDVFVHDRDPSRDGFDGADVARTKMSRDTAGGPANGASMMPFISPDGSRVAFVTSATDVVAQGRPGIVVRSRTGTATTWASPAAAAPDGVFGRPVLDRNGDVVAFSSTASNLDPSDTNGLSDVFRFELGDTVATRVSLAASAEADGASLDPSLVDDGSTVAFTSFAANFTTADTNRMPDVFRSPGDGLLAPSAPAISGTARGDGWVSVAWNPPTSDGGAPITGYTITASPGGATTTVAAPGRRAYLVGLTNGVGYSVSVRAVNAVGPGLSATTSSALVPTSLARDFTTRWTAADAARTQQTAQYLGITPAELQRRGVAFLAFLLSLDPPATPTPSSPPPATGTVAYTTTWPAGDQPMLTAVGRQYALTPAEAQQLGASFVSFLVALGGN